MSTPAANFDIVIDKSSENEVREKAINKLPSTMVEKNVEELGVVKRDGKLQILDLVWAFMFGFRRSYNSTADETLFPAASLAPVRLPLWKPSY